MKEQIKFDLNLVRSYVSFLRGKGAKYAPFPIKNNLKKVSTPLLSWIYYNRNSDLSGLASSEFGRKKQVTGSRLMERPYGNYQKEENIYQQAISIINRVWPEMNELISVVDPIVSRIDPKGKG